MKSENSPALADIKGLHALETPWRDYILLALFVVILFTAVAMVVWHFKKRSQRNSGLPQVNQPLEDWGQEIRRKILKLQRPSSSF
jgi:cell division protein FtsL